MAQQASKTFKVQKIMNISSIYTPVPQKEYIITLSDQLAARTGVQTLSEVAADPQKAIKLALEKIGYKVRIHRTHSYSRDPEGDIVARYNAPTGFDCFYKVRVMIKI